MSTYSYSFTGTDTGNRHFFYRVIGYLLLSLSGAQLLTTVVSFSLADKAFWSFLLSACITAIAGGMLVFIPVAGELVIPTLVGDAGSPMIGRLISDEFSQARDWPMAAAIAVALLVLMVGPTMIYSRYQAKAEGST